MLSLKLLAACVVILACFFVYFVIIVLSEFENIYKKFERGDVRFDVQEAKLKEHFEKIKHIVQIVQAFNLMREHPVDLDTDNYY